MKPYLIYQLKLRVAALCFTRRNNVLSNAAMFIPPTELSTKIICTGYLLPEENKLNV